jgi:hypothetical protein
MSDWGGAMLIATFGPTTGWVGKKITFDNDQFILEGHGPISASDVMQYDQQGHLAWTSDGTRAWVGAKTRPSPSALAPSSASTRSPSQGVAALSTSKGAANDPRTVGQKSAAIIGLLLVVCGLGSAIYFFAFFDTSVPVTMDDGTSLGRVNNMGLMSDRQNGILVGFGMAAVGGVFMFIGRKRSATSAVGPFATVASTVNGVATGTCGTCGGVMQVGALFCSHCGKTLSWTGVAAP